MSALINPAVCKPGEARDEVEEETQTKVVIDSRDRNTRMFPNPNRYDVPLDNDVRDVYKVKLVVAKVPQSAYLIDQTRRHLPFKFGHVDVDHEDDSYFGGSMEDLKEAQLEAGDYNAQDLAQEMERAMNEKANDPDTFRVSYVARQDKFVFRSKEEFTMLWRGKDTYDFQRVPTSTYRRGNLGRIVGFDKRDAFSKDDGSGQERPHVLTAPFRRNFSAYPDYVIMRIDGLEQNVSSNPVLDRSFAIITKEDTQDYDIRASHTYDPPVARFNRVRISFYDYEGNPYDFQNQDHRLELLLVSRKQKRLCIS